MTNDCCNIIIDYIDGMYAADDMFEFQDEGIKRKIIVR